MSEAYNTAWVLTSRTIPADNSTQIMREPENLGEHDCHQIIGLPEGTYQLTKSKDMKGVPFDRNTVLVAFLGGNTEGSRFESHTENVIIIADVELINNDTALLLLPNGSEKEVTLEHSIRTITPERFRADYLS